MHDADSIINMVKYRAAADEKCNRQEAIAPEINKTANMVDLGIERMQ